MDAAVVEKRPDDDGEEDVREHMLLAQLPQEQGKKDEQQGHDQQREIDAAAVEQGDDKYGDEVVRDGQGRKENLQ